MTRILAAIALGAAITGGAAAQDMAPREGWEVRPSDKPFAPLLADLLAAVPTQGMGVVTEAGPTEAAAARGVDIPGNRVVGVFNNDVAVQVLTLSVPAMIEAPIRFYVTESAGGSATLSWKTPSHVFAPYMDAAPGLDAIAADLDARFAAIADTALQ